MKAVVIGAGRIGCGLVGQVLRDSGYQVVFVGRHPGLLQQINQFGCYGVRLVWGTETQELLVDDVRALPMAEPDRVVHELAEADLIATAVRPENLPYIAP